MQVGNGRDLREVAKAFPTQNEKKERDKNFISGGPQVFEKILQKELDKLARKC